MLTPKQEKFVQGLVAGLSQRQAYKEAYPSSEKWQDNTIDARASELANNSKILVRYRELVAQGSKMVLWTRESAFNEYEWLKNKAKKDIELQGVRHANSQAFLSSLEGMNQLAFRDLDLADKKLAVEIEKTQADIKKVQTEVEFRKQQLQIDEEMADDGFIEALQAEGEDVWQEQDE